MPTASWAWPSKARSMVCATLSPAGRAIGRVVARLDPDEPFERFFWVVATVPPGYQPRHPSCRGDVRLRAYAKARPLREDLTRSRPPAAVPSWWPAGRLQWWIWASIGPSGLDAVVPAPGGVARGRDLYGHAPPALRAEAGRVQGAPARAVALVQGTPAPRAVAGVRHGFPQITFESTPMGQRKSAGTLR